MNRSVALACVSLALLTACGPKGSELEGEVEDFGAIVREAMGENTDLLRRTQTLSRRIEAAWSVDDGGQSLATLASDPAAFQSSIAEYLAEAGLEQLPAIRSAAPTRGSQGEAAAIMIYVAGAKIQLTFDPELDPARLSEFQALPPGEQEAAILNGPPAPPAANP